MIIYQYAPKSSDFQHNVRSNPARCSFCDQQGGDDSTSDDPTSTIAVITSPAIPSFYSCIPPKSSPVYGLDDTVSFVWNSACCLEGGYFCHSYRQGLDEFDTSSWFQSYWGK